ncbi:hypothetical protein AB4Z48_22735 [Cupriavidus sp. 2TAF22]|uniref:hypothetical protein n=1 Tax=unclassified Cupriavidus TaxID=2640874 RepID=UPI003F915B8F
MPHAHLHLARGRSRFHQRGKTRQHKVRHRGLHRRHGQPDSAAATAFVKVLRKVVGADGGYLTLT